MKLRALWMVVFLAAVYGSNGQAVHTSLKYKAALRPALTLPLTHQPAIAEQTILAKLKETGYKPENNGNMIFKRNKDEGFYNFSGVQLPELANQKLDLYFKVDKRNGDSSYNSAISLLVSKGYDNFVSPETDAATFAAAERFLNGFVQETGSFQLGKEIEAQQKKIAASEKKWKELRNKQEEASKKIAQLEADRKNWQSQEQVQQQEVDKERAVLQEMEGKRVSAK